jgi:hypothetical protein
MSAITIGVILVLSIIAVGIATLISYINIALAQSSSTAREASPSNSGESPPPSVASSSGVTQKANSNPASVASSSGVTQKANSNPAPAGNVTASAVGAPPKRIIVGPSSVNASPVTTEIQGGANTTSIPPNNGLFLGTPPGR